MSNCGNSILILKKTHAKTIYSASVGQLYFHKENLDVFFVGFERKDALYVKITLHYS